jgi:hypothetical protein
MSSNEDKAPDLPKVQRIIVSLIVPFLGLLGFGAFLVGWFNPIPIQWTGSGLDIIVAWFIKGALALIFIPFLLWAAVRSAATRWQHWWSALLGGIAATAAAYALGLFVILLLLAIAK